MRKGKKKSSAEQRKHQPPVKIPLPFDKAVDGLLQVKPKAKSAKKKPAQ